MPHHVHVRLPDGRTAVADWRDPIVPLMRELHRRDSPDSSEVAALARWLDSHRAQSAQCEAGTCSHD